MRSELSKQPSALQINRQTSAQEPAMAHVVLTTFSIIQTRAKNAMGDVAIPISLYFPCSWSASCDTCDTVKTRLLTMFIP